MRVIYQGMRTPILPENEHRRLKTHFEQTHDLRLDETPFLLNYGRQVRRKGVADFIEKGFPLLRDDIRLFISGSGPMQDRISAVIKSLELQNRVFILGRVDDSMIAMLRREAQLFLMPNIHLSDDAEGFGIAPLECMYNGLPVVAFSVDALGESLGEAAFLVPPNDYPAFIKQIHRYLDLSPQEKERIRTNAQAYVRREYTWEKTTAQYMEVFEGKA
jgi:glycosyltransferase involved in cell wall biosynthesis